LISIYCSCSFKHLCSQEYQTSEVDTGITKDYNICKDNTKVFFRLSFVALNDKNEETNIGNSNDRFNENELDKAESSDQGFFLQDIEHDQEAK